MVAMSLVVKFDSLRLPRCHGNFFRHAFQSLDAGHLFCFAASSDDRKQLKIRCGTILSRPWKAASDVAESSEVPTFQVFWTACWHHSRGLILERQNRTC